MILEPLGEAIQPGLALLPPSMRTRDAELLLLAIGLQESGFLVRKQYNNGPAHGLWQFEKNGGVKGVLQHRSSTLAANVVCFDRDVIPEVNRVWERLATDDVLAAAFARLLLWTSPKPLPKIGEIEYAWEYYLDNWRPGKPHQSRWANNYRRAKDILEGLVTV